MIRLGFLFFFIFLFFSNWSSHINQVKRYGSWRCSSNKKKKKNATLLFEDLLSSFLPPSLSYPPLLRASSVHSLAAAAARVSAQESRCTPFRNCSWQYAALRVANPTLVIRNLTTIVIPPSFIYQWRVPRYSPVHYRYLISFWWI